MVAFCSCVQRGIFLSLSRESKGGEEGNQPSEGGDIQDPTMSRAVEVEILMEAVE